MSKKSIVNSEKFANTSSRNRSFATVVYLESAPENWRALLEDLKIPCLISPYHDKDTNPDGSPKKPHFHILFHFEGKKSVEQVRELVATFGGVGVEVVNSMRGYGRYLCHLDNPEKAQYNISDVVSIGGIDYADLIRSAADRHAIMRQMAEFCIQNDIVELSDLYEYALFNNEEWFQALNDSCAYLFDKYIRSRRHRLRPPVDDVSGNEDVSKCSKDVSDSSTWCGATREEWEKLYSYAIKEPPQSSEKSSDGEKPAPDDELPF